MLGYRRAVAAESRENTRSTHTPTACITYHKLLKLMLQRARLLLMLQSSLVMDIGADGRLGHRVRRLLLTGRMLLLLLLLLLLLNIVLV